MSFLRAKTELPTAEQALPGHPDYPFTVPESHFVTGRPIRPPFPDGVASVVFGLGCFWGAEEIFWRTPGVFSTAVGYCGGVSAYPTYDEVCTGRTGHTEAVLVAYDTDEVSFAELLARFFEVHDPTQGMRQGNDIGTQYRSAIYYTDDAQRVAAERAKELFGQLVTERGLGPVATEIAALEGTAGPFYFAEGSHQQYLAKNPNGYRCHAKTGIEFPRAALAGA